MQHIISMEPFNYDDPKSSFGLEFTTGWKDSDPVYYEWSLAYNMDGVHVIEDERDLVAYANWQYIEANYAPLIPNMVESLGGFRSQINFTFDIEPEHVPLANALYMRLIEMYENDEKIIHQPTYDRIKAMTRTFYASEAINELKRQITVSSYSDAIVKLENRSFFIDDVLEWLKSIDLESFALRDNDPKHTLSSELDFFKEGTFCYNLACLPYEDDPVAAFNELRSMIPLPVSSDQLPLF